MSWPCYLINLIENKLRFQKCTDQFALHGLDFERVDAINGWKLTPEQINEVYDPRLNKRLGKAPLVPAEIGCYLSHFKAWQSIASGEVSGGFIFEDDFNAASNLGKILESLSCDETGDWEMVKLFSYDQDPKTLAARELFEGAVIVQPFKVPTCLIGYGLTKNGARQLVKKPLRFFRPVDEDQKFFWETELRVSVVLPSPIKVGDQTTVTGTVGDARRIKGKEQGGFFWTKFWRGLIYQARYNARLYFHRYIKK